jgi:ribonuclease HI
MIYTSFSSSHNKVGMGMFLRDADECFVLAKTTWFSPLCLVDVGEALGLCQALQWVVGLGFDNYDFSMDSKIVVDVFIGNNNTNINFGCIICHCKQMCNTLFTNT